MFKRKNVIRLAITCAIGVAAAGCENYGAEDEYSYDPPERSAPSLAPLVGTNEAMPNQVIALSQPATETMSWLTVDSSDFDHNQAIPQRFSAFGRKDMPTLNWSQVPKGTRSFVVIVEDPDSHDQGPFVQLILYNIPSNRRTATGADLQLASNSGEGPLLGQNSAGLFGYAAPAPPMGDRAHSYHFEVFALDTLLNDLPHADKQSIVEAMNGHVLAKGETVGTCRHQ